MKSTLAEVLDAARALSRTERAEVAHELIASLETMNEPDEMRYSELKAAVKVGVDEIDRGEGINVPASDMREYIHGLRREAIERVARESA